MSTFSLFLIFLLLILIMVSESDTVVSMKAKHSNNINGNFLQTYQVKCQIK